MTVQFIDDAGDEVGVAAPRHTPIESVGPSVLGIDDPLDPSGISIFGGPELDISLAFEAVSSRSLAPLSSFLSASAASKDLRCMPKTKVIELRYYRFRNLSVLVFWVILLRVKIQ